MRSDVISGEHDGNVNVAFAEQFDADMWDAIEAASTKPFGFQACYSGPDVGGHRIPITLQFLTWASELWTEFVLVENAQRVNEWMPTVIVDRIKGTLADRGVDLDEASIVTLGVAYKPDVGDTCHSVWSWVGSRHSVRQWRAPSLTTITSRDHTKRSINESRSRRLTRQYPRLGPVDRGSLQVC